MRKIRNFRRGAKNSRYRIPDSGKSEKCESQKICSLPFSRTTGLPLVAGVCGSKRFHAKAQRRTLVFKIDD